MVSALTESEIERMVAEGYHTSIFGESVVEYYDTPNAHLGAPESNVWAMPTEDAARIHTPAAAAREIGMASTVQNAYLRGDEIYAVHFPVDRSTLTRPTVADAGGWSHFYEDPTNTSTTYGHTAVSTGAAYLVNSTRETLVPGGSALPPGSVLTRLQDGGWVIVRRYK